MRRAERGSETVNDDWYEIPGWPCHYTLTDEAWEEMFKRLQITFCYTRLLTTRESDTAKSLMFVEPNKKSEL